MSSRDAVARKKIADLEKQLEKTTSNVNTLTETGKNLLHLFDATWNALHKINGELVTLLNKIAHVLNDENKELKTKMNCPNCNAELEPVKNEKDTFQCPKCKGFFSPEKKKDRSEW